MADSQIARTRRQGNHVPARIRLLEAEVARRYAAGESARALTKEFTISKNTVMRIAINAGVARTKAEAGFLRRDPNCHRKRRNDPPRSRPAPSSRVPERIKQLEIEIVAFYKGGVSFRATARQFSIGNKALRRLLARHGIQPRGVAEAGMLGRTRKSYVPIDPDPTVSISEQVARHYGYGSSKGLSKDREFRSLCEREYAARNPDRHRRINSRRAKHLNRVPQWANKQRLRAFYEMANDLGLTVDHIIPLQGQHICGLHVENNLKLMSYAGNCAKGNKFDWTSDPLIGPPICGSK